MLPYDYALVLLKATPGEHLMFDLRRKADEAIAAIEIEHVHVFKAHSWCCLTPAWVRLTRTRTPSAFGATVPEPLKFSA
jgi:hypothetical protein